MNSSIFMYSNDAAQSHHRNLFSVSVLNMKGKTRINRKGNRK